MRRWAADKGSLVVHCLLEVNSEPAPNVLISDEFTFLKKTFTEQPETEENALEQLPTEYTLHRIPSRFSALYSKGLQAMFQERGIKSVVLCGLATSGVVLRTVCTAADEGYITTIIDDACGDRTREKHELVIDILKNQANVTTSSEFMERWET